MKLQVFSLAVGAAVLLAGCSTGPSAPEPGTPAYLWNAAGRAYSARDMVKANDYLSELQQSDNEYSPRARIWQAVLAGGMVRGYLELADGYESGERLGGANSLWCHKQMMDLRAHASHVAMDFTQAVHAFVNRDPSSEVQLNFGLPPGSASEPAALRKAYSGAVMQEAEAQALETAMVDYGVVRELCLVNGTANDSAQLIAKFKAEVKTPRAMFLSAAAKTLYETSTLFGPKHMDQPQRLKLMCQEALAALHSIPETKESAALAPKLSAMLKKIPSI
jgi:hypothetical protein